MAKYKALKVTGMATGLVQEREEFIIPDDAYPVLQNAYVWRERILRKQGCSLLGRLQRTFTSLSLGNSSGSVWTFNLFTQLSPPLTTGPEANATINPGSVVITIGSGAGAIVLTDQGNGNLTSPTINNSGTINYITYQISLTHTAGPGIATTVSFGYFPNLPVMGVRTRNQPNSSLQQTVFWDTKYAYIFDGVALEFKEFIPGTTWSGTDSNFFWTTNFWTTPAGARLFWATNFKSGNTGDPIRYTDGSSWTTPFNPQIDSATPKPNRLNQCLALLPYRGRLVAFNTFEGELMNNSVPFPQRVRWAQIGNPTDLVTSWNEDTTAQAGHIDLPTSESITAVGFVRDNVVIYTQQATWQLRFTGQSVQPFTAERVNSELGAQSAFSTVQFDTSLTGIGDKGVVDCDGYKSDRIDLKIPDLVFSFNARNDGPFRVQSVRDFVKKLAYFTYPYQPDVTTSVKYPNKRLVYNYENDSWAIFDDSFTALGTFQALGNKTWLNAGKWINANFNWLAFPVGSLQIAGGNQQGFIEILDQDTINDATLYIKDIQGNFIPNTQTLPTVITSPSHNLATGQIISISGIPLGKGYATLNNPQQGLITGATQANPCKITSAAHGLTNGAVITINNVMGMTEVNGGPYTITIVDVNNFTLNGVNSIGFTPYTLGGIWINQANNVFYVVLGDLTGASPTDKFQLWVYNPGQDDFSTPRLDVSQTYIGGGQIAIRDNFIVQSKKFNNLDEGESIQLGYIDVLMVSTPNGAITLKVFENYNESNPVNQNQPDTFFNTVVPTTEPNPGGQGLNGTKYWQRVYCPTRGNFITIVWTLSNAQMVGIEQESEVQIDAQVLWLRNAGRMTNF